MFATGRLPDEVLEHIFRHLDTRTVTMVVPRVCRRWEHVCAHAVFAELDLSWARASLCQVAGADAWTAAVRSVVRRVRGARRVDVSGIIQGWKNSYMTNGALKVVCDLKEVTNLSLYNCEQITDAGLAHLGQLSQLTNLDLGWCKQITDAGLAHLGQLSQLTNLNPLPPDCPPQMHGGAPLGQLKPHTTSEHPG